MLIENSFDFDRYYFCYCYYYMYFVCFHMHSIVFYLIVVIAKTSYHTYNITTHLYIITD